LRGGDGGGATIAKQHRRVRDDLLRAGGKKGGEEKVSLDGEDKDYGTIALVHQIKTGGPTRSRRSSSSSSSGGRRTKKNPRLGVGGEGGKEEGLRFSHPRRKHCFPTSFPFRSHCGDREGGRGRRNPPQLRGRGVKKMLLFVAIVLSMTTRKKGSGNRLCGGR